ncbi:MAG: PAS domain S-box protein, partial [Bacteroidota bacterium]
MSAPLRVLILDNRPSDAELMVHELHKVGLNPEWVQVETEQDYLAHLDRSLDIILADYHLPQFDAPRALQLLQGRGLNIPFIVVTGVLGDEPAVELMKLGAADYLLKDRLGRLGQTVVKALEQKQLRRKHKRAEEALKFTQFAIDRAGEPAYWMDSQARFFYVNDAACRSLGYSREELLSMTVHDIDPWFPAESWPRTWEEVKKRRCFTFESHHRTKHGRIFPVEITVNYMEFEGKEYNCAFARDITKRRQAEETLKEMNVALANILPGISQLDIQGRYVKVNEVYARMVGSEPSELIGSDWKPTIHPDDQGEAISAYEHMLRDGKAEFEARAVRKDNSVFYKHVLMVKIVDKDDNFIGHHCFMRDITARKQAQDQIERHRQRLAALHEIELAITSSLDLHAVLDVLIDKIGSLLPYFATEVWLFNSESRQLERIACGNLDKEEWIRREFSDTPPLLKAALEEKAPLFVSNVQTDPRILDPNFFRKHGLVSYLGVPLIAKGEVLG